jgi:hypothetical protein
MTSTVDRVDEIGGSAFLQPVFLGPEKMEKGCPLKKAAAANPNDMG